MTPVDRFRFEPLLATGKGPRRSQLIIDGHASGKEVAGAELHAQFNWHNDYLLIASEDVPFEEALQISLVDGAGSLLDAAEISTPYGTGVLRELAAVSEDAVQFSFFADDLWRLAILQEPQRRLPWSRAPGVRWTYGGLLHQRRLDLKLLRRARQGVEA